MSRPLACLAPFALLALAACADARDPLKTAEPTAPAAVKNAPSRSVAGDAGSTSSVCRSVTRERDGLQARVAQGDSTPELLGEVQSLDAMVEDTCH